MKFLKNKSVEKFRYIKNSKKGFVSIESVFAMSGILMFLCLFIGIFSYTAPRILLEKEVQTLAQTSKIQGGLTDEKSKPVNSDIKVFKDNLVRMGYKYDDIKIEAKTIESNRVAIGVTPLNQEGTNYIKREDGELIEIIVTVNAKKNLLTAPLKFLGLENTLSGEYVIREVVGSERW